MIIPCLILVSFCCCLCSAKCLSKTWLNLESWIESESWIWTTTWYGALGIRQFIHCPQKWNSAAFGNFLEKMQGLKIPLSLAECQWNHLRDSIGFSFWQFCWYLARVNRCVGGLESWCIYRYSSGFWRWRVLMFLFLKYKRRPNWTILKGKHRGYL